jgi:hypothetical protein
MCGRMLVSGVNEVDFSVISFAEERGLSLYLFRNWEFDCLYWCKVDTPQNLKTILRGTDDPTLERSVVIIVLGYTDYLSIIGFDLSTKSHLFTNSSSKYQFNQLTSMTHLHATNHFVLSTSCSLLIFPSCNVSDPFPLHTLTLKVASSKRSVNQECVIFNLAFSVSYQSSSVVLISQSTVSFPCPI